MLARMQHTLETVRRQIHRSQNTWLPKLNSDAGTRLTWAKAIESPDNVPEIYKEFFETHLSDGQVFPYTVLTPGYERFGYRITEKVICVFEHEIHILERNGKTLSVQCYPFAGVSHVQVSSMLLESRVKISGMTRQGIQASSLVRFNSTTDYLFEPVLRAIRLQTLKSNVVARNSESEKFDHWISLNYKFMNFARNSLLGEEKVICAVLQSEIRRNMFTILGKTYSRTISPTHAMILTDGELITISEEARQNREDKYGGLWDYIHLNKITALSINREDDNCLTLSIQLLTDDRVEFLFQSSMKNEVEIFMDQFRELTSG